MPELTVHAGQHKTKKCRLPKKQEPAMILEQRPPPVDCQSWINEPLYTNYTYYFKSTLDYICQVMTPSSDMLWPVALLEV